MACEQHRIYLLHWDVCVETYETQCHYWVHIHWQIFHLTVKSFLEKYFLYIRSSFLSTLNRGKASDTFSAAPIKQILMEEEWKRLLMLKHVLATVLALTS